MWTVYRLSALGTIITGRTPPSSRPECFGGDYPFITPTDMDGRKWARSTERYLSEEGATLLQNNRLPAGSIAVSCIGWQMGKAIRAAMDSFTNQQLNSIIPDGPVDAEFLYYSLLTRRSELFGLGSGIGVRTPILNKSAFGDLELRAPDLPTQRKIAAILCAYDDLIENNTRRIAVLEEMARLLYREWFIDFRFPGHESVPIGESTLGDMACELRRAVGPAEVDAGTPYVGLEHIPRRSIALGEWGSAKQVQSSKLRFNTGDILFGKIRPYFHKVAVAPVSGICSSDAIVIAPKQPDYFGIVLCLVSSDDFIAHASQTSQGTKMPRANWSVLTQYPVPLLPDTLMAQFNSMIADSVGLIQSLTLANRVLRQTRDFLLPRLISGEIDVEDLDIDTEGLAA